MPTFRNRSRLILAGLLVPLSLTGWLVVRAQSRPAAAKHVSGKSDKNAAGNAPHLLVEAVTVRMQTGTVESEISGQAEPCRTATIASEVANRVLSRPVRQGDYVAAGAVLAQLDSSSAQTALQQAEDALKQERAARQQAETDYTRSLVETDANRQSARAQVRQAQADARKANAQARQAAAGERKTRAYTRTQELRQAEDALMQARSDETLAKIEYDRYVYLVKEGAAPQQTLDRTKTALENATAHRQSAEQVLSLAHEGARDEDKEAANAQVQAANAQAASAGQQIESAQAAWRIANTRETRLAVIRRQIDGLKAREAQAADNVRQARIVLDKHTIRAPFAGRVLAALTDVGDLLSPGTPILRIGETRRIKAVFAVPEAVRPTLHLGQAMTLTADALKNHTFSGTLTALGYQADPKTRAFPIEITAANSDEALLPSMVIRMRLASGTTLHHVLIPASGVASDGTYAYVYVLHDGKAQKREVWLGAPVGNAVEVVRGLSAGETIAATPQRLSDGANVQIAAGETR